jgi:hypothetical protein
VQYPPEVEYRRGFSCEAVLGREGEGQGREWEGKEREGNGRGEGMGDRRSGIGKVREEGK